MDTEAIYDETSRGDSPPPPPHTELGVGRDLPMGGNATAAAAATACWEVRPPLHLFPPRGDCDVTEGNGLTDPLGNSV